MSLLRLFPRNRRSDKQPVRAGVAWDGPSQIAGYSSKTLPIPVEVILDIASRLPLGSVLQLSLTSSEMRSVLLPVLYENVKLRSGKQCKDTLTALVGSPHITRHIRKLHLCLNITAYAIPRKVPKPVDEDRIADIVKRMAASDLTNLQSFAWRGLELPKDSIWVVLRKKCPRLDCISLDAGIRPLSPSSNLFKFENLTGFSLTGREGNGSETSKFTGQLPDGIWNMLIDHCPKLNTLTLQTAFSWGHCLASPRINNARWPELVFLSLDWTPKAHNAASVHSEFASFLEAHKNIQNLHLGRPSGGYIAVPSLNLSPSALPRLHSFHGVLSHGASLPNPSQTSTLQLSDSYFSGTALLNVSFTLSKFLSLNMLIISVRPNNSSVFRSTHFPALLKSCPFLSYLHIRSDPPFTGDNFNTLSTSLRELPRLRTFVLSDPRDAKSESMVHLAKQIACENPRLKEIILIWLQDIKTKQAGSYELILDCDKNPISLRSREYGYGLFRRPFDRRYSFPLV